MDNEVNFLELLDALGVPTEDRRPGSNRPLPYRFDTGKKTYAGYRQHDFLNDCRGICVHHSATPRKRGGRLDQHAAAHLDRWDSAGGLAYTIAITPEGVVTLAWDLDLRLYSQGWKDVSDNPATLGDENIKWKGVLVDGNFAGPHNPGSHEQPTAAQIIALDGVRFAFAKLFGMRDVTTHSAHGKPACPGEALERWVQLHSVPNAAELGFELSTTRGIQSALEFLSNALDVPSLSPGPVDGKPGPKTTAAIVAFQSLNDLYCDGIVGPKTIDKLADKIDDAIENGVLP